MGKLKLFRLLGVLISLLVISFVHVDGAKRNVSRICTKFNSILDIKMLHPPIKCMGETLEILMNLLCFKN